jgi:hypothetical protein
MTITLRPEHEQLIAQAMKTGAYQSQASCEAILGDHGRSAKTKQR